MGIDEQLHVEWSAIDLVLYLGNYLSLVDWGTDVKLPLPTRGLLCLLRNTVNDNNTNPTVADCSTKLIGKVVSNLTGSGQLIGPFSEVGGFHHGSMW